MARWPRPAPPTTAQELARTAQAHAPGPAKRPVGASGPLVWAAPFVIGNQPLGGIACPTVSLCVAVDDRGYILSSTDPSAGARSWHSNDVDGANSLTAIACPAASLCVAVDGQGNAVTSGDPSGPPSAWTVSRVDSSITEPSPYGGGPGLLRGVSCPTVSFCLAVDSVGNAVYSSDPTGGPAAWGMTHIDDDSDYGCQGGGMTCQAPLMGVSCPSVALCAAVDFTGNILQSNTPAGPAPWLSEPVGGSGPQSLWSVSCPTTGFCATVDGSTGESFAWDPSTDSHPAGHRLPIDAFGIWCSSAALCVASGEDPHGLAELIGSSDPGAAVSKWNITDFGDVGDVSCPAISLCVAVDDQGQVIYGVTVASLATTLRHTAIAGHIPRLGALVRRGGYSFRFASPIAGTLQIKWERSGTLLATASAGFASPQARQVAVRLTGSGRALLRAASRVPVTATATFQTNTGSVSATRRLVLRG